jgi:hypothetical protein
MRFLLRQRRPTVNVRTIQCSKCGARLDYLEETPPSAEELVRLVDPCPTCLTRAYQEGEVSYLEDDDSWEEEEDDDDSWEEEEEEDEDEDWDPYEEDDEDDEELL